MIRKTLLVISLLLVEIVVMWVASGHSPENCWNGLSGAGLARRREDAKELKMKNVEELSAEVVDAAFHLHRDLGPGLYESVYEAVLTRVLERRGLRVES